MARVIEKVKYTSPQKAGPFTVTLVAGYLAAPEGVSCYMVVHGSAVLGEWALVEATRTGSIINIDQTVYNAAATPGVILDTETTFIAADQAFMMNQNLGGKKGIFLLGQSNMSAQNGPEAGNDGYGGWNAEMDKPDPGILQWRASSKYTLTHLNDSWIYDAAVANTYTIASDPLDHIKDTNSEDGTVHEESVGCGMTFAKEWKAKFLLGNNYVALFPCGKGGTGVIGSNQAWNSDPNTGNGIGSMMTYTEGLMNQFLAEHPDNEIVAILYQQGETDALIGDANTTNAWKSAVQMLIDRVRNNDSIIGNLRQPSMSRVPFIIGGIKPLNTTANNNIQAEGQQLVLDNNLVGWSAADPSWGYMEFSLHADAEAQRHRGRLLMVAYEQALLNYPVVAELPGPLNGIGATEIPGQATISWNANIQISPAITAYEVKYKVFGTDDSTYVSLTDVPYGTETVTQVGLTNGTNYTFSVSAKNSIGIGPTATVNIQPELSIAPTAVLNFTAVDQPEYITLAWDALTFDPAVTGYIVEYVLSSGGTYAAIVGSPFSVGTLTNNWTALSGSSYDFRVRAVNSIGEGTNSAVATMTHSSSPTLALGPTVWYRKGIDLSVNGDSVTWLDQSGNNRTPAVVAGGQVVIEGGGINCDAGGLSLDPACDLKTAPGFSCVFRAKRYSTGTGQYIIGANTNTNSIKMVSGQEMRVAGAGFDSANTTGDAWPNSVTTTFGVVFDAAARTVRTYNEAGTLILTKTAMDYDLDEPAGGFFYLGTYRTAATSLEFNGVIYDFVLFNEKLLSAADLLAVIGELPA